MADREQQAGGGKHHRAVLPTPGWIPARWLLAGVLLALTVGGLILIGMAAAGKVPWWVAVASWVALVWNAYVWGWRLAYEVRIDDATLHWRGLVRHGQVPIADVVSVKSTGLGMAFRDRRGVRIQMLPLGGLEAIIRHIQQRNPAVTVDTSPGTRGRLSRP